MTTGRCPLLLPRQMLAESGDGYSKRVRLMPLFLLPTTQLLLIPSYVALSNHTSILALPLRSLAILVLISLASTGLMLALHFGLSRRPVGPIQVDFLYLLLARFALYFIVLAGYAFPVSRLTGLTDPSAAPLDRSNLLLCFVLSSILLALSESNAGRFVDHVLVAYICANLVAVLVGTAGTDSEANPGTFGAASEERNIFVLSFDGLSRRSVLSALEGDPSLRTILEGFTVFERSAASSPATSASIAAELYGNQNFKLVHSTINEVWDSRPSNLLTNVLAEDGYRVTTYGLYGTNLEHDEHRVEGTKLDSTGYLLVTGALARTLTSAVVPDGTVENIVRGLFLDRDRESDLQARTHRSAVPEWSRELVLSVKDYERFVTGLHVDGARPSAFFLHFTHTHYPIQFDGSCTYRGDDPTWLATHQTSEADIDLARCALLQLDLFLGRLEELRILEQSIIVFKSDHGKPISYAPPGSMEATAINGHPRWGVSRYAPFLAVRPFQAAATPMRKTQSPVLIDDLARTLCEESEAEFNCIEYPGFNILRDRVDPESIATLFIVEGEESDFTYDDHRAITLRRGEDVVRSLSNLVRSDDAELRGPNS